MNNYSLTDLEARLASLPPASSEQERYRKIFERLLEIAAKPRLTEEQLLPLAQKVRPIYRFNHSYLYWLTPTDATFPGHYGSLPVITDNAKQNYLGIRRNSRKAVKRFDCYSLEPWHLMFFDLAELFRQMPEDVDVSAWQSGAFELRIKANMESVYDPTLRLYVTPVILYKISEDMPELVQGHNPLPLNTGWTPLF